MSWLSEELADLAGGMYVVERTIILPNAGKVQLCTPNPLRWGLIVVPALAAGGGLSPWSISTNPSVGANVGWTQPGSLPSGIQLSYRAWGVLVQQAWYAWNSSTQFTLSVFETLVQQ